MMTDTDRSFTDPDVVLDALIRRAQSDGMVGDAESAALDQHLAAHPADQQLARALASARTNSEALTNAELATHLTNILHRERRAHNEAWSRRDTPKGWIVRHLPRVGWNSGAAATCMAIIGVVFIAGMFMMSGRSYGPTASDASVMQYTAALGEGRTIKLGDGTHVILRAGSTLTVPSSFGRDARQVAVVGEAHFTVTNHQRVPFIVRSGNATTRVLGTAFVVRRYASDTATRVFVANGRVALDASTRSEQVVLDAGMLAQVGDSGRVVMQSNVSPDDYTAWIDGRLVFRGTPLREVAAELERTFGVRIRIADTTLFTQRITLAASAKTQSLSEILDLFMPVIDARYTRADSVITIKAGRQLTPAPTRRRPFPFSSETMHGL